MRFDRSCSVLPGVGLMLAFAAPAGAQGRGDRSPAVDAPRTLLIPDQVWTGADPAPRAGWVVLVRGNRIEAVGPRDRVAAPAGTATTPRSWC